MANLTANTIKFGPKAGQSYATRFTARLVGGPELAAALARLEATARTQAAKDALLAAGTIIEDDWRSRVPVGPGSVHYRDAIGTRVSKTKTGASGSVQVRAVAGATDDDAQPLLYASKLEFGRSNQQAQPSARPAFDAQKGHAVDVAEEILRRAVVAVR